MAHTTGHRGRPVGAVRNLFNGGSCRHHCASTASARRRLCKNVQSFRDRRAEPVCDDSRSVDSVVLEEGAMDATV